MAAGFTTWTVLPRKPVEKLIPERSVLDANDLPIQQSLAPRSGGCLYTAD